MINFFFFSLGIIVGVGIFIFINLMSDRKIFRSNTNYFKIILNSLNSANFLSRVNNEVQISIDIGEKLTLFYIIDKNDIVIFNGNKCVKTSFNSDKIVISDIILKIYEKWGDIINNTININGSLVDTTTYNRIVGNLNNQMGSMKIKNPKKKIRLDDVLDKINDVGINSLSLEEKNFLKNFNNGN